MPNDSTSVNKDIHNETTIPDFTLDPGTEAKDSVEKTATPPEATRKYAPWPPPPRPRPKCALLPRILLVTATTLAILLFLSSVALIVFSTTRDYRSNVRTYNNARAQETRSVLTTAQARVQGTTNAINTAQARIEATATAQANQTPVDTGNGGDTDTLEYLQLYSKWTNNTTAISDPLSDSSGTGKWDRGSNTRGAECRFKDGEYHVREGQRGYLQPCIAQTTQFSNFAYQVNVSIIKDLQARAGLLFRVNSGTTAYYFFHIGTNGTYALDLYNGTNSRTLNAGTNAALKPGLNASNMITVIADGSTLYLFANDEYLTRVTDATLTGGKIGVGVIDANTPAEAAFSNAQVWKNRPPVQNTPTATVTPPFTMTPTVTVTPTITPTPTRTQNRNG